MRFLLEYILAYPVLCLGNAINHLKSTFERLSTQAVHGSSTGMRTDSQTSPAF